MSDFNDYKNDHLYFLPLGGSGEYGGNLNCYQYNGQWLMVDLGISFADPELPGVDIIMPDPAYLEKQRHRIAGLVITHAHEDHIGAVIYLWSRLQCPIYVTPFCAAFLRAKISEMDGEHIQPIVHIIQPLARFKVGIFDCRFVPVTHSIPESSMLEIITPLGRVVHTGDWKLDATPLVGAPYCEDYFREMGEAGVLAAITDSTNSGVAGRSGSESSVRDGLYSVMKDLKNRIAITCFASNLGRVRAIIDAARLCDRQVALVGRSLWRFDRIARELGYFDDLPEFVSPEDVGYLPKERIVIICTGSQGEANAALARIAAGEHPEISLEPEDHVIFSARVIPGNEIAVGRVQDKLIAQGYGVIAPDTTSAFIHSSGHPCRDEVADMYQWLRPKIMVPVHGERRQQEANAEIARQCQVQQVVIPQNGTVIQLAPDVASVVGYVTASRLALDGKTPVSDQASQIRDRKKMLFGGSAMATVVLDAAGRLIAPPKLSLRGLSAGEAEEDDVVEIVAAIEAAFDRIPKSARQQDDMVEEAVRIAIRRTIHKIHGKKPVTDVHIVRV